MTLGTRQDQRGVTLIELLVVVAIIGVLAGIAYPSYQRYTTETRRTDAHIALSQMANELEKFYSECGRYTNRITGTPRSCTSPAASGSDAAGTLGRSTNRSPSEHYQLSITLASSDSFYTITATPREQQASTDRYCTTLTLTNTGVKSSTGSDATRCWRK